MKRILSAVFLLFLIFILSSCEKSVSMEELISYESSCFKAEALITRGEKKYKAEIEKNGDAISFRFSEPDTLSAFVFTAEDGKITILVEDVAVISESEAYNMYAVSDFVALFEKSPSGIWKIKNEILGGVKVYVCENEDTVLYIDNYTHLPLKIISGNVKADIISFEKVSSSQ
ncbi:MAG: hypothetical protein ACI4QR_00280 [Eubacteriales bacterium]